MYSLSNVFKLNDFVHLTFMEWGLLGKRRISQTRTKAYKNIIKIAHIIDFMLS